MTNKEAIFKLIEYRRRLERDFEGTDYTLDAEPFDMAIEALESKQEWIPCSERLPENNGQYLISTTKGAVYVARRSFGRWGSSFRNCVTAWQPLPDPYEEVQE